MRSRLLALGLIVAVWGRSVWRVREVWPLLPERVASHFNAGGVADRWSSKQGFLLFWVGTTVGLTLFLLTIVWWVPWGLMNVPNKEYWQDPERQAIARRRMAAWCTWFCLGLNLLLAGVLELSLRANLMAEPHLSNNAAALLVGFLTFTGLMMVVLFFQFRVPPAGGARP